MGGGTRTEPGPRRLRCDGGSAEFSEGRFRRKRTAFEWLLAAAQWLRRDDKESDLALVAPQLLDGQLKPIIRLRLAIAMGTYWLSPAIGAVWRVRR